MLLATALVLPADAGSSTNNGSNPKGKPFVELQGQIVEVQNDISTLEASYLAIVARVESLELADTDFQAQIDAINLEIAALEAEDLELQGDIDTLATEAAAMGANIDFLLTEHFRIIGELAELEQATGDNTAAIDTLESELTVVTADIAVNADGVVTALAGMEQNADLIALLLGDVADLQFEVAAQQDDVTGSCPTGTAVTTINDDGSLVCGFVNTNSEIVQYQSYSGSYDLDRYSYYYKHWHGSYYHNHYYTVSGSRYAYAYCPSGYKIAGGGFTFGDGGTGNVRVRTSIPSGSNRWYVYFDNLSTYNTSGYSGRAYANCVKTD